MVPEKVCQGLKYKMKCMAPYFYIDLYISANPIPSHQDQSQQPKIILIFLTCLI